MLVFHFVLIKKEKKDIKMSGMGLLLADWSIELIRSRRKRGKNGKSAKKQKQDKNKSEFKEMEIQTELPCDICLEKTEQLEIRVEQLQKLEEERENLEMLVAAAGEAAAAVDLVEGVEKLVDAFKKGREETKLLKEEGTRMAECVGRQLVDRDSAHSERIKALEQMMGEKEKHLQRTATQLRRQLEEAQLQAEQLSIREQQLLQVEVNRGLTEQNSCQQEIDSLKIVLDMKREETDNLRSTNNHLTMEVEHYSGIELRLQEARSRVEEMTEVIHRKNNELRQLLEEYDGVQSQLEDEVRAHLSCQQELEKTQWTIENFVSKRVSGNSIPDNRKAEKISSRNTKNKKEDSGLILDVVQKNESVAWSFNIK